MKTGSVQGFGPVRRLVCVSVNSAIDKTAAVERLVPGEIHRPELLSVVPGGKPLNVARSARALGLDASAIVVLGGHAGDWIEEQLAARGIRTRAVRVSGETRTCLSILDRERGGLTEFYETGLELGPDGWAAVEEALRLELASDPSGTLVAITGSLPPGAPLDGYCRLARMVRERGARAAVDVGGAHLVAALAAEPWLAKVNAREAAEACGLTEGEVAAASGVVAARELRRRGATTALVTLGVAGAGLVDDVGREWLIGAAPERGRYPVGSGDALLAGFAAALARGASVAEAARHGAAVACANALRPGQAEFDPSDVGRLLPAITLRAL